MRRVLGLLLLLALQVICGLLLSFAITYVLGFNNVAKLLVVGLGSALAVWGVGAVAQFQAGASPTFLSLVMTVAGSFLGVLLMVFVFSFSHAALLLPLLGALFAYYLGEA